MTLKELQRLSIELSNKFPLQYDLRDNFIDLVEEVGELAQALQISHGRKHTNDPTKQRSKADVTDALCDILFELFRIADKEEIDLSIEYIRVLEHIQSRLDAGEFILESKNED